MSADWVQPFTNFNSDESVRHINLRMITAVEEVPNFALGADIHPATYVWTGDTHPHIIRESVQTVLDLMAIFP